MTEAVNKARGWATTIVLGTWAGLGALARWLGLAEGRGGIAEATQSIIGLTLVLALGAGITAFFAMMASLYATAFGSWAMGAIGVLIVAVQLSAIGLAAEARTAKRAWLGWAAVALVCIATNVWMLQGQAAGVAREAAIRMQQAEADLARVDERLADIDRDLEIVRGAPPQRDAETALRRLEDTRGTDGRTLAEICLVRTPRNLETCTPLDAARSVREAAARRASLERERTRVVQDREAALGVIAQHRSQAAAGLGNVEQAALIRALVVDLAVSAAAAILGVLIGRRRRAEDLVERQREAERRAREAEEAAARRVREADAATTRALEAGQTAEATMAAAQSLAAGLAIPSPRQGWEELEPGLWRAPDGIVHGMADLARNHLLMAELHRAMREGRARPFGDGR